MATATEQDQITTTVVNDDGVKVVTQSPLEAEATEDGADDESDHEEAKSDKATEGEKEGKEKEEKPAPKKDKKPWYQTRIDELTAKVKTSESEKAGLRAALEAKKKAENEDAADDEPITDVDALATTKAKQIVVEKEFTDNSNKIYDNGLGEFADWKEAMENYTNLGGLNRAMIEAVLEMEYPHRVLHAIAQDMDEAARIMSLPPIKMAVAIAKIQGTEPKQKKVSKLPPPIETVKAKNIGEKTPEEMTADEYDKWAQERRKKRRGG